MIVERRKEGRRTTGIYWDVMSGYERVALRRCVALWCSPVLHPCERSVSEEVIPKEEEKKRIRDNNNITTAARKERKKENESERLWVPCL